MMAVGDDAGPEVVVRQLLPDVILVARQHGVRTVAEMRRELRSGGDSRADARRVCRRVAERDDDAGRGQLLDERQGAIVFRSERVQTNAPAGSVLKAAELVPVGRTNVAAWVSAARTVLGADVRSFEMKRGDGAGDLGIVLAGFPQRGEAVQQRLGGVGDEGGTQRTDAVLAAGADHRANGVGSQSLGVEAVAAAAVDLQVEESRSDPVRSAVCGVRSGNELRDDAVRAAEIEEFAGGVMAGLELHESLRT